MPKGGNGGGGGGPPGGGGGGGSTLQITGIGDNIEAPGDQYTDDRTLTLWGTSAAGATVTIYADGVRLGTTTADGGGNWTYTTTELADGSYDFTAETGKGKSKELSGTYTVEIDGANTPPAAADDSVTTSEDTPVTLNVLTNDSDADGNALSVTSVTAPSNGSVTFNANGTVTYTPDANWSGTASFTYQISDGNGGTDTATVTVTVDPVNDAPTAAADSASTAEDTPVSHNVLTNDSDPDGDSLSLVAVADPAHGSVSFAANGTITYTPDANWSGTDTVQYTVSDGTDTSTGILTVTVDPANDPPVAGDDSASTERDMAVILSVLANDSDPDGDALTVTGATDGSSGTVTNNGDGTLTYNPNAGFSGVDTFTYTVSDRNGGQDTATVTVTVADSPPPAPDSFTPTDPIYAEQWHLAALGDIERIWAEFTGQGVSVGIYDDGIEYDHVDLDDNYDASKHLVYNNAELDPYPATADEAKHGTAVAGVIAGEANGLGTVGVAFDATLTGVNIFSGAANVNATTPSGFNYAISQMYRFDVLNHSWGPLPVLLNDTASQTIAYIDGARIAAETGRGGLGSLIVKSAGNWADNANGDDTLTTRHTIAVAAYDSDFDASWYTNRGANLLVSAPSSGLTEKDANGDLLPGSDLRIATTDRDGTFGYADDGWSSAFDASGFGGTSSSAPTTVGVIALMLDANEGLGWRDVQKILAYSARQIGGDIGVQNTATEVVPVDLDYDATFETTAARPVEYFQWDYNGADDWNGGGLHFSQDYGYGALDAYNAVRMAEVWTLFAPAQTSANELVQDQLARVNTATDPSLSYNANHANGEPDTVSATWTYTGAPMEIEYVNFEIQINLVYMQGVTLTLTSPEGTVATLLAPEINDYTPFLTFFGFPLPANWDWSFGIAAFKGENPTGDWTFTIQEVNTDYDTTNYPGWGELEGGQVNWFEFGFYGTAASADDVFHYTDEVFATLANEPGRLTLTDASGNDWLDMAAMTGDIAVDLATNGSGGATAATDGAFIGIAADTQIENAVTGDGDDVLTGNSASNQLAGMRGDDQYWGLGGGDTFIFFAGGGQDLIWDFDVASTTEVIELHGFGYDSFTDLTLIDLDGTATLIDLSLGDAAGDQITLAGVNFLALTGSEFDFV